MRQRISHFLPHASDDNNTKEWLEVQGDVELIHFVMKLFLDVFVLCF